MDLSEIRDGVENFCMEVEREWYLNRAGLKDELNVSAVYTRYAYLLEKGLISDVRRRRRRSSGEEERRSRYLQAFLMDGYLSMAVKELTDRSETAQSKETVRVDGERVPFRLAAVRVTNEPDRSRRARLFRARNRVIEEVINPILRRRMERLHEAARELGYEHYMALYQDVRNVDFMALERLMREFARQTEPLYLRHMGQAVQEKVGVLLEEAEKHDVAFLFRAKEFDGYFKRERAVAALRRALARMGIRLDEQPNIGIDVEERPKKSPRAFCAAIRVPDEVRLVIMPRGGREDYASLFHEAGHAEHFGCVDPGLEVEYRRLGDNSVTEGFAFLLEYLTLDENWLRQNIPMGERVRDCLRLGYLHKLYFLRRYGAKLSYEVRLHADGLEGMGEAYRQTLERSLGFRHPGSHYLIDHDDGFYCSQYLRAWIFEAQLRQALEERFGEEWFGDPRAGEFLLSLWADGQKYDVTELAQMLGHPGLDMGPLLMGIRRRLG